MGWTSYNVKNYNPNGTINRKAECDKNITDGSTLKVLKSQMVGSTYYAAVENKDGEVFAAIFLTTVDMKDYYNFSYKPMEETMGPCECKCPKSILKLLTPTENEYALEWRRRCEEWHEKVKLSDLPIGTVIEFTINGVKRQFVKREPAFQFKKAWWCAREGGSYIPTRNIPDNFQIILWS